MITSTRNTTPPPPTDCDGTHETAIEQWRRGHISGLMYSRQCAFQTAITIAQRFGIPRDALDHEQVALLAYKAYIEQASVVKYPCGWIAKVVRNMLLNEAMSAVRRGLDRSWSLSDPRLQRFLSSTDPFVNDHYDSALSPRIQSAIDRISPLRRAIVQRVILEHEEPQLVRDDLHLSAASLRQLLSRTKRQLKDMLGNLAEATA